jgi:hypothetical protein
MNKSKATAPATLFVAVVVGKTTNEYELQSNRIEGDWASFLGRTEQEAINKAAAAVAKWNTQTVYDKTVPQSSYNSGKLRHHRGAPYRIFVGSLSGEAEINAPYTIDSSAVAVGF